MNTNINLDNFKYSQPIEIRWNDLDPLYHVNNVYYFDYFQTGRGHYMHAASSRWDWSKYMFVIAHIECDYLKELKILDRKPTLHVRTTHLGGKSFEMEYLITSQGKNGETVFHAKGKSVQVFVDIQAKSPVEIPDWVREDITSYEPAL